MKKPKLIHVKTISDFHRLGNLPKPHHPLISVIDYKMLDLQHVDGSLVVDCYAIAVKRGMDFGLKYGQHTYDFDEGIMMFTAPNQVIKVQGVVSGRSKVSGWILLVHPDFLWKTPTAANIQKYEYFNYSVHEALFLSDKEEFTINNLVENIKQEYQQNIDQFSQDIILSQIETLLSYADRFYQRQFVTRKIANHQLLERMESLLNQYFAEGRLISEGLPSVQYIANALHISASYLGSLTKTITGQSPQQLIHDKLLVVAKEKLAATRLSVSEIAYQLGFEHSQSFSKFFKGKTLLSPLAFRNSFN